MVNKRVRNAVLGCNLKNDRMISIHFQGKTFNITVIQVYAPTTNAEEAEVEQLYEDIQDLLELTPKWDAFFIIGERERESENCSVVPNSLRPHRLYRLWNSPGQNTGVGNLSLLHCIFLTQESNQSLLHCRWILYQLICEGSYEGSHHRDWNARVGSQEIPGITGKFGLGVQNEAGNG